MMFDASGSELDPEDLPDEWIIPGLLKRVFPPAPVPKALSIKLPAYPPMPGTARRGTRACPHWRESPGQDRFL